MPALEPRRSERTDLLCATAEYLHPSQVDFGLVTLAEPVGQQTGWLGLQAATLTNDEAANLTTVGQQPSASHWTGDVHPDVCHAVLAQYALLRLHAGSSSL